MGLRVLGLDPGTAILGYGLVDFDGHDYACVEYGAIRTPAGLPLADRLVTIHRELEELVERTRPGQVAVEELFFSRNAKTALAVGHARGVILLTLAEHGYAVHEYTPMQIKQALVGYGGADKVQIQSHLQMLLNLASIPKPDDAADALAVAVCHTNSHRLNEMVERARSGW